MENDFGFKDLYEVSLNATYPIEVGDNVIEAGETIALFDKIQIANFQEIKNSTSARGGFDNRAHMSWETTKEIKINLAQGVFSKSQFALMSNAQLINNVNNEAIILRKRERHESDESGRIVVNHQPCEPIFVYDYTTGKKMGDWSRADNAIYINEQYKDVIVDYGYEYINGSTIMRVGKSLTNGYLSLTGKMRVKDDTTGKVVTGIIKIPKLRLMSDLSMRVGSDAIPQVGRLDAVAVPEGGRGQSKVMEIIFLNDDIDADM